MKNTIHFITIVALLFIPVSAKADVYSTLQSEVAALTTSTPFVNVVATDKKVTEAASAGLITKAQYDLLDAIIINIYRNSTAFSQLSYSSMPADPNHQNRTGK